MKTKAQQMMDYLAARWHKSTRTELLNQLRRLPGYKDTGLTEEITFSDGSKLEYDHTANPGFEWRIP